MRHKKYFNRIRQQIGQQWDEIRRAEASATGVARAFAVGTFIGLLPLPGLDLVLTSLLLRRFKEMERLPLFAAMALWNNVVAAPLYIASPKVGTFIVALTPYTATTDPAVVWVGSFLAGNLVITAGVSTASYVLVYLGFSRYKLLTFHTK